LNLPDTYIIKKKKLTEKEQSSRTISKGQSPIHQQEEEAHTTRTISKNDIPNIKKKKNLIGQEQSPIHQEEEPHRTRTISDTSRRRRRRIP
jgi:hypothetical protein